MPLRRSTAAVPLVARIVKPRSTSRLTGKSIARLSRLATETKIAPERGSAEPPPCWALLNAVPKFVSMPITSPVERISGPRSESTAMPSLVRNRVKGSTASLHDIGACSGIAPPSPVGGSIPSSRSSCTVAPSMTRAAALAIGTPVALATKGTVREARGLASMT